MFRSLAFKLTLAFLIVAVVSAALIFFFIRWTTVNEFDRLLVDQGMEEFTSFVAEYYEVNGTLDNFASSAREYFRGVRSQPQQAGEDPPMTVPFPFILVNQDGVTVFGGKDNQRSRISKVTLSKAESIEVDGEVIGYIVMSDGTPFREPREEAFLAETQKALLYATAGSLIVALIMGLILARTLTNPLRELTNATQAMADGNLEQQVNVESNDELGELAVSFNQMSSDLTKSNHARRQMTADIAHDLRTPLSVITGYIELLRDEVLEPDQEMIEVMWDEAQHLNRLVEDLRTLSLADAGELTLNLQVVAPLPLLERAAAAYRLPVEQNNISLKVSTDKELPKISLDPERFAQVLGNLIQNAIHHTPPGGEIVLSAEARNQSVIFAVRDNGAGITPETLPYVFDRFYRGDTARVQNNEESGSGLGLAIVKSIIEMHGGQISVESELGKGTAFIIKLPAAAKSVSSVNDA